MPDYTRLVLDELLRFRQAGAAETVGFRDRRHNSDLCPAVERQLNAYLDCSVKYHRVAYDVQGPRDRGTDVLLRYELDDVTRFLAIQIKSFHDLVEAGYLGKLKAQVLEVQAEYGDRLQHCFLLLCTDTAAHANQLRNIKKDFATLSWVTVVDPAYCWTFLRLSPRRIDAVVQAILKQEDAVFSAARRIVADRTPLELAILFTLVKQSLWSGDGQASFADLRSVPFLQNSLSRIPDWERDEFFFDGLADTDQGERAKPEDLNRGTDARIAEALEVLNGAEIDIDTSTGLIELNNESTEAIAALLLDAKVRLGYEEEELLDYTFEALDIDRTFQLPE